MDEAESQAKGSDQPVTQLIEIIDAQGKCIHPMECTGPT
jgi:hypothetical protein